MKNIWYLVHLILLYVVWPILVLAILVIVALFYAYIWLPFLKVITDTLFGWAFVALSPEYKSLLYAFLMFGETILFIWLGFTLTKILLYCARNKKQGGCYNCPKDVHSSKNTGSNDQTDQN